jgi:hypothetical protein
VTDLAPTPLLSWTVLAESYRTAWHEGRFYEMRRFTGNPDGTRWAAAVTTFPQGGDTRREVLPYGLDAERTEAECLEWCERQAASHSADLSLSEARRHRREAGEAQRWREKREREDGNR